MSAATILASAIGNGFNRLSERDIMLCILQGASSGGTGGWTHGAGSPIVGGVSPMTYSLYTNDTDSTFWTVSNGAWIQLV